VSEPSIAPPGRVLLTGASRGIGRAIAEQLIARGARLAVVGRDRRALRQVVNERAGHLVLDADLADPSAAEEATSHALHGLGGLDAFVACAGIADHAPIGAITRAKLERQLTVNFTSPMLMAQRAGVAMAEAGSGSMVLVASTLALGAAPHTAAYAASKAALVSAARSLALELGPRGVRVNAVAPGVVDTDMVRSVRPRPDGTPDPRPPEQALASQLEGLRGQHLLGRLGTPEEVAEAVLYLLCAPFVTGTMLTVDGGLQLGPRGGGRVRLAVRL